MEHGNLSPAAGFGFDKDKYGVFSTFAAFLEMCISEITMARRATERHTSTIWSRDDGAQFASFSSSSTVQEES